MIESLALLCRQYGLNPATLLIIYAVKVVFFWVFFMLAVRSLRKKEYPATLLWGSVSFVAAVSPYAYILIQGSHIPLLAVIILCLLIGAAFWGVARKLGARS